LSARDWQRRVGYVPQDVFIADSSVRRNIAFGVPDHEIDDAAVSSAIDGARLQGVIDRLPSGLETRLGERGVRLSGGERQRIAIARALYTDPEILVFDEATSAIDAESEEYILAAVRRLRGERTIVIVAHRLSTVRECQHFVLLADGLVVASGSYDDVMAYSGLLARNPVV